MVSVRKLGLVFVALFAVAATHPLLPIPSLPPIGIDESNIHRGLRPLPSYMPSHGSDGAAAHHTTHAGSDEEDVAPLEEPATGNQKAWSTDDRANFYRAPCVYDGPDSELQLKQICFLGQTGFLPLADSCKSMAKLTHEEAQLTRIDFPNSEGQCKLSSYSARCELFRRFGILRGILESILGCSLD